MLLVGKFDQEATKIGIRIVTVPTLSPKFYLSASQKLVERIWPAFIAEKVSAIVATINSGPINPIKGGPLFFC